ncbi:MAG TPA: histidine kinase dimerization/phosphoacceptor domain -containing protein, partial [Methanotrichaceae archaeon]|nr:histidine kinase dimerization/phosphoacceptor domain -containing protein [Methanotrichaceae archaeon]
SGSRETVLFCIGQDITKRKRAELELLQSEKKFRGIVENTQDGIALIDELGHVVEWNIGQEKITGLERSSVLGQLIWDIQSKTDSSEDNSACDKEVRRRAILEILSTGRMPGSSGLVEQELTIEDGSRKIVQSQVFTIGTEKGFMMGLISRDVTEWKKAQEDLQRARGLLEIKVAERTSELGRANEILKAEIAERKRAEELITSSLNEKEVLLREIHHRVKNNLQVVSSLLYLQSRKIDDPQVSEVFKESQNRIKSMALIHEKLYRSGNLAKIDFSEYAKNLILYLFDSYGVSQSKISLKMEMEHVLLGVDTAVPCGLIINELISNSLKHAFAEAEHGEIEVSLRSNDAGRFLLKIRDNGVGLSDSLDLKNAGTLGLQLVNILVAQIDGHIEAKSEDGAEFEICFEELKYRDRA